ncbi:hypothetical protein HED60_05680 [Planctomycetales bacterium ZRK34]|nr:hypothetical protein HED60_05680 [Planctomycetales bacterium ZRK34]
MKTLIATLSVIAALTLAAPAFAGPNTGQPSAAQRMAKLAQHRQETVRPYALTGARAEAQTKWELKHVTFGASRHQHIFVRTPAN